MVDASDGTADLDAETLHASACHYLIQGEEFDAAGLLLFCTLEYATITETDNWNNGVHGVSFFLRGPRASVERIDNHSDEISKQVHDAFRAVLPDATYVAAISIRATTFKPDANWKLDLLEMASGRGVTNQAVGAQSRHGWQGFRFRSATEIRIAAALDRAGVLFFPLPKARVPVANGHKNIEPDFVVCHDGQWGVIEVDGEPFHPPERSAIEHDRDRLLRNHGVRCVERFDASRCYNDPYAVVAEFITLLAKSHART